MLHLGTIDGKMTLSTCNERKLLSRRMLAVRWVVTAAAVVAVLSLFWNAVPRDNLGSMSQKPTPPSEPPQGGGMEVIGVYALAPLLALRRGSRGGRGESETGDPVTPASVLVPNGTATIHEAHARGLPHGGVWVHVVDTAGKVLLLRRAEGVRTCPGTWSFIGEHRRPGEDDGGAHALRAAAEELGLTVGWLAAHVARSGPLAPWPVWETHRYADGRHDREVSLLWALLLDVPAAEVPLRLDADAGGARWLAPRELEAWLIADEAKGGDTDGGKVPGWAAPGEELRGGGGTRPDFCDAAIRTCVRAGLRGLDAMLSQGSLN